MAGIFISYRRGRETAIAKRLYERLKAAFPHAPAFLDEVSLGAGDEVEAGIARAVAECDILVALIGEGWLTAVNPKGARLSQAEDYVRFELTSALSAGKRVVPVLIDDTTVPDESHLPRLLRPLADRNALALSEAHFDQECPALIERLARHIPLAPSTPPSDSGLQPPTLPHEPNPFFTGRDEDLARLHAGLRATTATAVRVQVVAAMGGVGKTTLANEYAHRYWRDYRQVLWVDARRGYEAEFALAFDRLFPERATADILPAAKAQAALAELNGATDRLLVIDNAEDAESVRPWLPRGATGCRTLVTSRDTRWPKAEGVKLIDLGVLAPEAARDFLTERAGRTGEAEACAALAQELGHLPLALEQAGAYIDEVGISVATYRRYLQEAAETVLGRATRGSTQYSDPVLATWRTTIDKLSLESRTILRLCAWYADAPIPTAMILEGVDDVLALAAKFGTVAPRSESDIATEARVREAIAGLKRYSMILDVTDESFRLHGLVQSVERLQAAKDNYAGAARERPLERLADAFPYAYNDPPCWPLCRQLMPHERALVDRLGPNHTSAALGTLLNRAASFLDSAGDAAAALPLYRRALDTRERLLGRDHSDTLSSVNDLALCLEALDDRKLALPLFQRALESHERLLGAEDRVTLISLNRLAICLWGLGDAKAALPLCQRALESQERLLGKSHPDTLVSMSTLASCLRVLGEAAAALPLYKHVLETQERVLGEDHPDTLASVNNLANGFASLGDNSAALPLLQRAAESSERVLGKEHPDTRLYTNNLAACEAALRG